METGIEAVETVPSRNPHKTSAIQSAGCPRCGAALDGTYKYCPNCSYRLRPDLTRAQPQDSAPPSLSHRLLALGGFLGFCALLLLVILTGMRLFGGTAPLPAATERQIVLLPADVRITPADLREIGAGEVFWGVYRPAMRTGPLAELLRSYPKLEPVQRLAEEQGITVKGQFEAWAEAMEGVLAERPRSEPFDPFRSDEVRRWARRARSTLEERGRATLPDIYRIDDNFSISVSEVTQEQWFAFLVARAEKSDRPTPKQYFPRSWRVPSGNRLVPLIYPENYHLRPVTDIDAAAATEFCNWIWEDHLGSDPDLMVDLPTFLEMSRAGRGGSYDNLPAGAFPREGADSVVQGLRDVRDEKAVSRLENGVLGLIGNAAEWVHFRHPYDENASGFAAAGWSYVDLASRRRAIDADSSETPFATDEVEPREEGDRAEHIGFRFVVRRVPAMPHFVEVEPGPVEFVPRNGPVIGRDWDDQGSLLTFPQPSLPEDARAVERPFSMADNEITNAQYLVFLAEFSQADGFTAKDYLPDSFRTRFHPLRGHDVVYRGLFGDPAKLGLLFSAGEENYPVAGVTLLQAEAYAVWLGRRLGTTTRLPTAAEFIRAGRGAGDEPYPWGDNTFSLELICDGRADDWDRAVSLYRFLDRPDHPIAGLCGNLLEIVRAPGDEERYWLAGGCYQFPPESCTLDDFLPIEWVRVWVPIPLEEPDEADLGDPTGLPLDVENPVDTARCTGFRVVVEEAAR